MATDALCPPVPGTKAAAAPRTSKRSFSRLRGLYTDVRDVLRLAVGRDDDEDYECNKG